MASGVLNLRKPAGTTSFQVVRRLRAISGARRVGHAGTLDPLATGVLPILFDSATRLTEYAHLLPKTYVADIRLGVRTSTDDAEGVEVGGSSPEGVTRDDVRRELESFSGVILQQPPSFSAVKVLGQRAYALARRGQEPAPAARLVTIESVDLLDFQPGPHACARIRMVCGSGTYLRSVARDLGERLGVGGHLTSLERTAYGPLTVEHAAALEELQDAAAIESRLLPPEVLLPGLEPVQLTLEQEAHVRQGRAVRVLPEPTAAELRAHDEIGRLVALGRLDPLRKTFVPEKVFS